MSKNYTSKLQELDLGRSGEDKEERGRAHVPVLGTRQGGQVGAVTEQGWRSSRWLPGEGATRRGGQPGGGRWEAGAPGGQGDVRRREGRRAEGQESGPRAGMAGAGGGGTGRRGPSSGGWPSGGGGWRPGCGGWRPGDGGRSSGAGWWVALQQRGGRSGVRVCVGECV